MEHNKIIVQKKAIGTLLGCMCGDVLGACVEGWSADRIHITYPKGLTNFQQHYRGYGRYTDDTQMTIALSDSIINVGRVDPKHVAMSYSKYFDMARGYGQSAMNVLGHLRASNAVDWETAASLYTPYPGSYGNGAAMRIFPIGIVYRNASTEVLHRVVKDACISTHTHPIAIDGAFIMAASVAWLMHKTPPTTYSDGCELRASLLKYLTGITKTNGLKEKLLLLSKQLDCMDQVNSWETYLKTDKWKYQCELQLALSEGEQFQIKADNAVTVALCAFLHHGVMSEKPHNAIIAACHYGGDTDTIAAMVGACVGALHGYNALPNNWLRELENGKHGRDFVIILGNKLANEFDA